MKLVSMKTTPKEAKEEADEAIGAAGTQPEYSCGLTINLDDAALAKLGIKSPPALGTKMMMTAQVEVCSATAYKTQKDDEVNVSLQITDMALDGGSGPSMADRLYGKKG